MSWAAEEWKADLGTRALQKVEQLEAQLNRFRKEAEMKQFKLDSMEQVIQKEKRRFEDERSQVATLKREAQSLSEACEDVEQKRQKLATDLHSRETTVSDLSSQTAHLRKLLEQETNKVSHLQISVERFESNQVGQDDKYDKLLADHDKLKQMNQHQAKDCSALRTECNMFKQKCSDMENKLLSTQSEYDQMKIELKDKSSVKSSEFKHVSEQLKVEKENMKLMGKKTSEELKALKDLLEKKDAELQKVQQDAKSREDKLVSTLKAVGVEIQNLKEKNNRKVEKEAQAKAKLDQEICELKNSLKEKEEENAKIVKDIRFLRDSLTNAQTSCESVKVDLKNKELTIAQQKDCNVNMQNDKDKQIAELQDANCKVEQRMKACLIELENMKDEKKSVQSDLDKKAHDLQNCLANKKNLEAEKTSCDKKIIGIEKNVKSLSTILADIRHEKDNLVTLNSTLRRDLDEKENVLIGKEREINQLHSEVSHGKEMWNELQKKYDSISTQLQNSEQNYRQFKNEADATERKLADEKEQLQENVQQAERKYNSLSKEMEVVSSKLADAKSSLEAAEKNVRENTSEIELLQSSLGDTHKLLENKERENVKLSDENKNLEMKSTELQGQCINLERTLADTTQSMEMEVKLKQELETKLEQLDQKLFSVNEVLQKNKEEKEELLSDILRKDEFIEDSKSALEMSKTQNARDQESINILSETVQKLKDEVHEKEMALNEKESNFLHEIEELVNVNEERKRQVDEKMKELSLKCEKIQSIQRLLEGVQSVNSDLETKLRDVEKTNEEINFLLMETKSNESKQIACIREKETEVNHLKDRLNDSEQCLLTTKAEFTGKIEELSSICDDKELKITALEKELTNKENIVCDLQLKMEDVLKQKTEMEITINRLEGGLDETKLSLEESIKAGECLNKSISNHNEAIVSLQDKISSKDIEFSLIKAQLMQEAEEYKQQIIDKDSAIHSLENKLSEKDCAFQQMETKMRGLDNDITEIELCKKTAENEVDELKLAVETLKDLEEKNQTKVNHLEKENVTLKDELKDQLNSFTEKEVNRNQGVETLQSSLEYKDTEIQELQAKISRHVESLEEKGVCIERLSDEKEDMKSKYCILEQKHEEVSFTLTNTQEEVQKQKDVIEQLQTESLSLKEKINTQTMNESVNKAALMQQITELQNVSDCSTAEIDQLKIQIQGQEDIQKTSIITLEKTKAEIAEYEMKINCLEKEKLHSDVKVQELSLSEDRSLARIDDLEKEICSLKDKLMDVSMEESINRAKMTQEINELNTMMGNKDLNIAQLEDAVSHKADIIVSKDLELKDISTAKGAAELKAGKFESDLEELKFSLSEAENTIVSKKSLIEELHKEIQTLKDDLSDQAVEDAVNGAKLSQQLKELQNIVEGKNSEIQNLLSELKHKQEELDNKCVILSQTVTEKTDLETSVTTLEMQVGELRLQIDTAKAMEEKQQLVIGEFQDNINALKDKLNESTLQHNESSARFEQEALNLNQQVHEKLSEIDFLKTEVDNKDQKLKSLEDKTEGLCSENNDLNLKVKELEAQIVEQLHLHEESKKMIDLYVGKNDVLGKEVLDQKEKNHMLEIENTEVKIQTENKTEEWKRALVAKDKEIASLTTELEHISLKYDQTVTLLDSVTLEKENAESSCSYLKNEIETLRYELNESVKESAKKSENLTILQTEIQNLKDELSDLSVEESVLKANLMKDLEDQKSMTNEFNVQIHDLKSELQCKSGILEEVTEKVLKLENDKLATDMDLLTSHSKCAELELVIEKLKGDEENKTSVITQLSSDNERLKDSLNEQNLNNSVNCAKLVQEVDTLKNSIDGIEKDNTHLKEELNSAVEKYEKQLIASEELHVEKRCSEEKLSASISEVEELRCALKETNILRAEDTCKLEENGHVIESLKEETSSLLSVKKSIEAELESLKQENANMLTEYDADKKYLQSDLDMARDVLLKTQNELQDFKQCKNDLEMQLCTMKTTADELSRERTEEKENMTEIQNQEIKSFEKQISEISLRLKQEEQEKIEVEQKLQKKISQLQICHEDFEEVQEQSIDLEKQTERLKKDNAILENSLSSLTERLTGIDMEKSNLSRLVEEKLATIDEKQQEIANLQEELSCLESDLMTSKQKVKDMNSAKSHMEEEIKHSQDAKENVEHLQIEVERLLQQTIEMEEATKKQEDLAEKLERKVTEQAEVVLIEKRKSEDKSIQLEALKDENTGILSQITHLENEKIVSDANKIALEKELSVSQEAKLVLENQCTETALALENEMEKLNSLKYKLESFETENRNQTEKIDALSQAKTDVEMILEKTTVEVNQLQDSLSLKQREDEEKQQKIETLQEEVVQLKDSLHYSLMEKDDILPKLQTQIEELKAEVIEKGSLIMTLQEENKSLMEKTEQLNNSNEDLKKTTQDSSSMILKYEEQIDELTSSLRGANSEISSLQTLIQDKEKELHELKENITEKENFTTESQLQTDIELNQLREMVLNKDEQLKQLHEDILSKSNSLSEVQEQNEIKQKQIIEYDANLRELKQDYLDLKTDLESRLNSQKLDSELYDENVSKLRIDFDTLQTEKDALQNELNTTELELKQKLEEFETLRIEKESLLDNVRRLEESHTDLMENIDNMNLKISSLSTEKMHAEQKLDEQEHQLQSTQAFSQNLQDQLSQHDMNVKSLGDKLNDLTNIKDDLESSLQQANIEIERLKCDLKDSAFQYEQKLETLNDENIANRDKILTLESTVSNREKDITDVEIEQKKLEDELMQLKEENRELKEGNESVNDIHSGMESEICQYKVKINQLEEMLEETQSNNAVLDQMKSVVECDKRDVLEENEQYKDRLSELKEDLNTKEKCIDTLNAEKQELIDRYNKTEIECQSNTSIIQDLEDSLVIQKQQMAKLEENVHTSHNEIKALQEQLQNKEQNITSLQLENSQKSNDADVFSADLSEAKEKIKSLMLENECGVKNLSNLNKELENLKSLCDNSEVEIEKLKPTISVLEGKLIQNDIHIKEQEDAFKSLKEECDACKQKLSKFETEKAELEELVEFTTVECSMKDDELAILKNTVEENESKILSLESDMKTASIEYTKREEKLSCLEKSHDVVQTEKDSLEKELMDKEVRCKADLEKLQNDLKKALNEVDDFKSMMESLEFENASLESSKSECESQLSDLKQALHASHQRQAAEALKADDYHKDILKQSDSIDSLNADVIEQKQEIAKLSEQREHLQEENKALRAKLDSMELDLDSFASQVSDVSSLQEQLQSLEVEKIELQQKLTTQAKEKNELLSQFLALEDKKYQSEKETSTLQAKVDDLRQELIEKERCLHDMGEKLDSSESAFTTLKSQLDESRSELSQLKEELECYKQCEERAAELENKLAETQRELVTLKQEMEGYKHCQERAGELESQLAETQRELVTLRQQLDQHQAAGDVGNKNGPSAEELAQNLEKWSSRCSKLNSQLLMEKKNSSKYLEQIKCLKADLNRQVLEKTGSLTEELTSVRKEANEYLDKYHTLTQRYTQLEERCDKLQQLLASRVEEQVVKPEVETVAQAKQLTDSEVLAVIAGTLDNTDTKHGEPVAKRLRNSTSGVAETSVESENAAKHRSPRVLSRSKRKAEASPNSCPAKRTSPKQTLPQSVSISVNQSNVHSDSDKETNSGICQTGKRPVEKKSAKGLRPTSRSRTDQKAGGVGGTLEKGSSLLDDLASSMRVKGPSEIEKAKEIVNKPLLSVSTLTRNLASRSQVQLDTAQPSTSKGPLATITNSPVKKGGSGDTATSKLTGPQRTLSLKKSPQIAKTRRRARAEEERALAEQEEPEECKVS